MQAEQVTRFTITPQEYKRLNSQIIPLTLRSSDGAMLVCELALEDTVMVPTRNNGGITELRRTARATRSAIRSRGRSTRQQQQNKPNARGKWECNVPGCDVAPYDTKRSLGVHKVKAHGIHAESWNRNQKTAKQRRRKRA